MMRATRDKSVSRCIERIASLLDAAGGIVVIIMVIVGVVGFIWRYLLGQPLSWPDEFITYCIPLFVMLCVGELFIKDRNIAIEVFPTVFFVKELALFLASLMLLISSFNLIWFVVDFGMYMPGVLGVPAWMAKICLLLGAGFMTLITGHRLILEVNKQRENKTDAD